ncbi:MAG: DNA internalization-related competence protein ComEC/Rec2 [Firmicutes bacterium]|nr:DNA internalization-related competence protein ComEC/Rec2 [Bacillota bacterium]
MRSLKTILQYNKLFIVFFIFLCIYILLFTKIIKYESKLDIRKNVFEGVITSIKFEGDRLVLDVKGEERLIAYYYVKSKEEKNTILDVIHHGDKIMLKGTLKVPFNNTIPNNFNYKKYLYNKKIYYTLSVDSYEIIKNNKNILYKIKDKLYKKIINLDNSDYYLAFILGDKTLLSSEIYNSFQSNGISHLLALSGMHINILLLIINMFLKKFKESKRIIITSIILIVFLILTGLTASLQRATIFYILKNINNKFNLRYSNIKLLFIVAFIILFINPFLIYDLGFIYSFIVCFGIFYYSDFIKGNYVVKLFKLSLVTFLFSMPITIMVNYEVNLSSIFINMLFVPWISLIVYPLSLISFIIPILNPLFGFTINITNNMNMLFSKISLIINIPKLSIILIILFYLVLLVRKKKLYICLFLILIFGKVIVLFDKNYYVYFFDIGQGDASVLVSPHQKEVLMIDTGGKITYEKEEWQKSNKTYNISDGVIKFLKSRGITKLDYLIISHGDQDHAGDALNIIKKLNVKKVVLNNGSTNSLEKKIINTSVKITNNYNLKYFKVINLNNGFYDNENDASLVNYITFLKYKFLFMGDASRSVEEKIIEKYNLFNIDVLKVGHHGSKTSSSKYFVDKIIPKYSVISVGRNNRYGHPHEEALSNLINTKILRTDSDGTITFKINKNKFDIDFCKP